MSKVKNSGLEQYWTLQTAAIWNGWHWRG